MTMMAMMVAMVATRLIMYACMHAIHVVFVEDQEA
jgi:hypothetical protein